MAAEHPAFGAFWQAYPKRVGKQDAVLAFNRAISRGVEPAIILAGLQRQLGRLLSAEPPFRPHPATWLNGCRWEDEETTGLPQPAQRGLEL